MKLKIKDKNLKSRICFFGSLTVLLLVLCPILLYVIFFQKKLPDFDFDSDVLDLDTLKLHFDDYLKRYGRKCSGPDYDRKFKNYMHSLKKLELMNSNWSDTAKYGINKFSDMSQTEFEKAMLLQGFALTDCKPFGGICYEDIKNTRVSSRIGVDEEESLSDDVPHKFDWRDSKKVGPVLDQKSCHSCWAFSVVGAMESMLLISGQVKKLVQLSVQELTDCSYKYNGRCRSGTVEKTLWYLCNNKNNRITTAKKYPLTNVNQTCYQMPESGVAITEYRIACDVPAQEIMKLVYHHGPLIASVYSTPWQHYNGGIIQFHCSNSWELVNHVVQIVGYDTEAVVPHFILRNSWGTDFGDDGYVRVAMHSFTCSLGRQIAYVKVKKVGNF